MAETLDDLLTRIRACRRCATDPQGPALPHEPRPVLQAAASARVAVYSQAPGLRVHESGRPFTDASGERLRAWLGMTAETFYDASMVAVAPIGFCFPGYDKHGGDLPPRPECAPLWRERLMRALPNIRVAVLPGFHAQKWHLGSRAKPTLTATVSAWREYAPAYFPTPHPSWRNNGWLKQNSWFERELAPALRAAVAEALEMSIEDSEKARRRA